MAVAKRNYRIPRGTSWPKLWYRKQKLDDGTRLPIDLTGATAQLLVYARESASTPLADWSAYLTLGGTTGSVAVNVPLDVVNAITWKTAHFRIFFTYPEPPSTALWMEGVLTIDG